MSEANSNSANASAVGTSAKLMPSGYSSFLIRRAMPDDIEAIAHVEIAAAEAEGRLAPLDFSWLELCDVWHKRMLSGKFEVLVAVQGTNLLGFIGIIAPRNRDGFIQAIYVDPKYFRRGIGSALLAQAELIFARNRCPRVVLYVEPLNHNGQRFYRRAGYHYINKNFRHLNIWVKEISSC